MPTPYSFPNRPDRTLRFDNFITKQTELIALRRSLKEEQIFHTTTVITSCPGNGLTHLLHAIANEMMLNGRSVVITSAAWILHIFRKCKNEEAQSNFAESLLSEQALLIDDLHLFHHRSSRFQTFFLSILCKAHDRQIPVYLGCNSKQKDLTRSGKFRSRFVPERIGLNAPDGFTVFRVLKELCLFEESIPENVIYRISDYNASLKQHVNCMVSIRFKSKAEGVDLKKLSLEEIEKRYAISDYFPKQQFRRSFVREQIELFSGNSLLIADSLVR